MSTDYRQQARIYSDAFAKWMPVMRERWEQSTATQRFYAKRDILKSLERWDELDQAYVAKLYAELDAIRDAELASAH